MNEVGASLSEINFHSELSKLAESVEFGFEYLGTIKAYIDFETEKPYEERIYRKKFDNN